MSSIARLHVETPLIESTPLGKILGHPVYLKLDALQPSGSFKLRGVGHFCLKAVQEGNCSKFVSSSGGNAGLAVAYCGRKLGIPVVVVVPETTKEFMRQKISDEGAEVIVWGAAWDEANQKALEIAKDPSVHFVHPFDHFDIWHGNSTMITEMKHSGLPTPSAIVTVVGGGGLVSGIVEGLLREGWGDVPLFACETEGAESFHQSWKAQKVVSLPSIRSIATSLGAKTISLESFERAKNYSQGKSVVPGGPTGTPPLPSDPPRVNSIVVSDAEAVAACAMFASDHRILVEPACGAGLAAIYKAHPDILSVAKKHKGPIVVVVCGGSGVSPNLLEEWKKLFL